ncbi:Rieske (2Fe-2S) protein [Cellulomonas sp. PhB143]|uniref:Rieske (2Fe-2S) protein n=1 Tax=Cellulomonas sp. PhB143 TaxID=2485186 RepID=UPI000F46ACD6|nr:Rieske (2Fe-2S) protein [Cellulomonas sp. PhB143]ROS77231.1 nitrite reductase/ring-hydroxylating ferredoxin subunit [Cellulomonas sp. PhB143]
MTTDDLTARPPHAPATCPAPAPRVLATTRRGLFVGTGAGAGALLLAACSGSGGGEGGGALKQASETAPLVALADVPVGGAVSVEAAGGAPMLVTQPTAGEVHAFSAVCTHQGCTVLPDDDRLKCPCHSSVYALDDASVVSGPAPEPLPEVPVTVSDGQVLLS